MATKTSLCTICDLRHLTTSSTHWCPECEEALCTNCKEHHSLSKSSRCHRVISISEYNCLPPSIVNIDLFCTYHNEKYLQYCVKHECPICYKCINEHGNCGGLTLLEELARDVKSSEVFRDMEQSLKDMIVNISRIREDRRTNIQMIQDKKKKIVEEVIQFRTQINQHLDKLQDNFITELNKTETECCEKMQSIVSPVNIQDKEIIQCNTEIEKMKKYASDIQTFLGMRNLQIKITKNEKCIESLVVDKKIEKLDLEYTIDATIRDLFTNVQKLGLITVKNYPSDSIGLVRKKDRQAQILATEHKQSGTNLKQKFSQKARH
ncbi:E3 ubiquitin/ISG15 ligase TRIM25-like [Mytilus californianus]|uniref:E3 ubiquitin/ISG15 ligase TRIM25-like n=1 Tax=Mytilus californianus TaxID=6549 RepID=UPI0022476AE2|nr:E3 ubiquitin/ISG15 ligase TRIM25-like [Mytilus californianus]